MDKSRDSSLLIRRAVEADWRAILSIYNHYIDVSTFTFDTHPFSVEDRREWFSVFNQPNGRYVLLIAEVDGQIKGYGCSQQFRVKEAYETSVEVSVYVRHDFHAKGVANKIYDDLFESLKSVDVHRAYAGITLPNEASIRLHENHGFKKVGQFKEVGRKFNKYWDVAWYEKEIKSL